MGDQGYPSSASPVEDPNALLGPYAVRLVWRVPEPIPCQPQKERVSLVLGLEQDEEGDPVWAVLFPGISAGPAEAPSDQA